MSQDFFGLPDSDIRESRSQAELSRRRFLVLSGATGLSLGLMGCTQPSSTEPSRGTESATTESATLTLNAYITLSEDGQVRIYAPNPDIGQGVKTALPMIVAEEMDIDWQQVRVESAPVDRASFGAQFSSGSRSVATRWQEMRQLGAAARRMLLQAAATRWSVAESELQTANGQVLHPASKRQLRYGELAREAAALPAPDATTLRFKQPADYRIVGQRIGSVDNPAIVTGSPIFGIDQQLPDMQYAVYCKCPTLGGKPRSANLNEIKALAGIVDAFLIEGTPGVAQFDSFGNTVAGGVAIVANSTWQALKARQSLQVDWDLSQASTDDTAQLEARALALLDSDAGKVMTEKGSPVGKLQAANQLVTGNYTTAMICHAQLEPLSCTAWHRGNEVEVWAASQTPSAAVISLQKTLGLPADKITVHQLRGGGGFGRRIDNDYVREAALISQHTGKPVKLQWSREDDMAFDFYRAPTFYRIQASLDQHGRIDAWDLNSVAVSPNGEKPGLYADLRPGMMPEPLLNHYRMRVSLTPFETPVGAVRAPITNSYGFAEQSFMHELATAAQRDHLAFLLELMGEPRWTREGNIRAINTGRAANVINRVARMAGWGRTLPTGSALGLSFFFSHGGHIAEVAEVSVNKERQIKVSKVWVAADIGTVINRSGAEHQLQGAVIDGLSTMAAQNLTVKAGQVQESNFHQYPLLRSPAAPQVEVELLESGFAPTGVGEPGLPPLAAAVCNAVYTATGHRIRSLPISREGFSIV